MLKQMRSRFKDLKWILYLVIVSFLLGFVWLVQGGAGRTARRSEDWVAKVDGRTITQQQYLQALQRQDNYLRSILQDNYDPNRFLNPKAVLDGQIERAVLLDEADRMGLRAAPDQVADHIRAIEAFKDDTGRFSRESYETWLSGSNMRAREFEQDMADDLRVDAMTNILAGGVVVTDAEVRTEWLQRNESAKIEYVVVPLADEEARISVSDDDARSWFGAHGKDFDAGPARRIRWVRFSREDAEKALEKDAEMRDYYEQNKASMYTIGADQRTASEIVVSVGRDASAAARDEARAKAEGLAARARQGADFAALAREASDDAATKDKGGDLGPFHQGVHEAVVDDAVFAASRGDVLGPLETTRGFEIVKVTKAGGEEVRPFDDVRALIGRNLYAKGTADALQAQVAAFQKAWAEKPDFDAAAKAAGVTPSEPAWVSRDGDVPVLGRNPVVTSKAFTLDVDQLSEPLPDPSGQVLVTVVDKRDTSPAASFEEVRAKVEKAVRESKARDVARAEAEEIRKAAASGTLASAAGERQVQTTEPFKHGAAVPGLAGAAPDVVKATFETAQGAIGRVADSTQGEVVFHVVERAALDESKFATEKTDIERSLRQQRYASLRQASLAHLRKVYGDRIKTNDAYMATQMPQEKGG